MAKSDGATRRFLNAPREYARTIDTVDDAAAKKYLIAVFNLAWEQNIGTINGRRGMGWFAEIVRAHVGQGFRVGDVTVPWLRDLRDDCLGAMPESVSDAMSRYIVPFFDVAKLDCEIPRTPLFDWAERSASAIARLSEVKRGVWLSKLLAGEETPNFELVLCPGINPQCNVCQVVFDTESLFVRELIVGSIHSAMRQYTRTRAKRATVASRFFTAGIGFVPQRLSDFTVETFSRQYDYFRENLSGHQRSAALAGLVTIYLHIIELLPPDQDQFTFATGLPRQMLRRFDFTRLWRLGYRAVRHEPGDPVPKTALWVIYPSDEELVRANLFPSGEMVDLTCDEPVLQKMLMEWAWTECNSVRAIRSAPKHLKQLIGHFERVPERATWRVTNGGILMWLNDLGENMGSDGLNSIKRQAASLVSYGQQLGLLELAPTALHLLQTRGEWSRTTGAGGLVNEDDVKTLASALQERSTRSLLDEAIYCVFATIGMTNLRVGDATALRLSDFTASELKGIHSLRVSTKPDGSGRRTIQIPGKVYRLLMGYKKDSEAIRPLVSPELSDYLFIYQSSSNNEFYRLTNRGFGDARRKTCSELGIPVITARDIRRLYQSEVVHRGIEKGYGRLAMGALTGHASIDTTSRYYVRENIRLYLEATYGLEIGTGPIKGSVVADEEVPATLTNEIAESEVEGGSGYCTLSECDVLGTAPCLMCRGFLTTPRCIPEMERGAESINLMLRESKDNQHEREHLLAVKRLYVRYLEEMYSVKMGVRE